MSFFSVIKEYSIKKFDAQPISIQDRAIVVAAKKRARGKNKEFHCFTLLEEELLGAIKKIQPPFSENKKRAHALVKVSHVHYTYVDIENNKGALSFFILDAAGDPASLALAEKIKAAHPDATVYCCLQRIQKSAKGCFDFSLSHAETFSKIDNWHSQLSAQNETFKKNKDEISILERKDLPIQAFKQSHRKDIIDAQFLERDSVEQNVIVNKHKENIIKHKVRYSIEPEIRKVNGRASEIDHDYIGHKVNTYKNTVQNYINGHYGKISLYDLFKETFDCRSSELLSACLGTKKNVQLLEEQELKYLWLKDAIIHYDEELYPILDAIFEENPNILDEIGNNAPLMYDVMSASKAEFKADAAQFLLDRGVSPNAKDPITGSTPLHEIIKFNSLQYANRLRAIKMLHDRGADLLEMDDHHRTIIDFLDFQNNRDISLFKELIKLDPRIAELYPNPFENPIVKLLNNNNKKVDAKTLVNTLSSCELNLAQKLNYIEDAFNTIKNTKTLCSSKKSGGIFNRYNETLTTEQINTIAELKCTYIYLIEAALTKSEVDNNILTQIKSLTKPNPDKPLLIDFNRTIYKFLVKNKTNSRKEVDFLIANSSFQQGTNVQHSHNPKIQKY